MECKDEKCPFWEEGRDEEDCNDCVDGRFLCAVSDYASTCDGCGELTHHEEMEMNEETQFGYCPSCILSGTTINKEDLQWHENIKIGLRT